MLELDENVESVRGVGKELAFKLNHLGIYTTTDLLKNYPRKWNDYSLISQIKNLKPGNVTISCKISSVKGRYVRRGMHITEAIATDKTGSVRLIWFNQPYRQKSIFPTKTYYINGEFSLKRGRFSISNPSIEMSSDFPVNMARIVPVYRSTKGLNSTSIRRLVRTVISLAKKTDETSIKWLVQREKLLPTSEAIAQMHFPSSMAMLERARQSLGFIEVFELSLAAALNKEQNATTNPLTIPFREKVAQNFVSHLNWDLTNSQRVASFQIFRDMSSTSPMNRLLQGDVGSGKTVVAAMAAVMAMEAGYSVALMAPTEILARQHFESISKILKKQNLSSKLALLVGSTPKKQKLLTTARLKKGQIQFVVGTHALISEGVDFTKLGLVIVDEQHRFGVEHRKKLTAKAGHPPHVLLLSATPIPRSLALTLYGELDISTLNELPPGRTLVETKVILPSAQITLNKFLLEQIKKGRQVFVVCPHINENDSGVQISATEVFERLRAELPEASINLLHGKLKADQKQHTMNDFIAGKIDILVCTTVIEVGIDVKNASVMVIFGAEAFGLAQIHQLRGRVGRHTHKSYCYLVPSKDDTFIERLRVLESTSDGFELAEIDLRMRGPGAIYGTVQHGVLDLRVANLTDTKLIARAVRSAKDFVKSREKLRDYPELSERVSQLRKITNLN